MRKPNVTPRKPMRPALPFEHTEKVNEYRARFIPPFLKLDANEAERIEWRAATAKCEADLAAFLKDPSTTKADVVLALAAIF